MLLATKHSLLLSQSCGTTERNIPEILPHIMIWRSRLGREAGDGQTNLAKFCFVFFFFLNEGSNIEVTLKQSISRNLTSIHCRKLPSGMRVWV